VLVRRPGPLGLRWNRALLALGRRLLQRRHAGRLDAVRERLGLPPHEGTPLIDPGCRDVPARLGLWDADFSPPPPDGVPDLEVVGFPPSPMGELTHEVQEWIAAGPPPLVVTLGSIAQGLGGARFWDEAAALARNLGLRAVLLHGEAPVPRGDDLLTLPYAAHAPLFPRAAAIVHHGGIGTTAEALRSGRPQLVVPVGGDQPDNAARLVRMGVAATLPVRRFTAARAAARIGPLLDRFDYAAATDRAAAITARDGAEVVARRLAALADEAGTTRDRHNR
jgi:UDP:flavonoid glycosyltransferase YjiC (YdhE family)